jgi:hypothetical protein
MQFDQLKRCPRGVAALCVACAASGCAAPGDGLIDGTGCGGCNVLAAAQNAPTAIVADEAGVYWIDRGVATGTGGDSYVGGAIVAASGAGQASILVEQIDAQMLAVSAAGVFFDNQDPASSSTARITRVGKDGTGLSYVTPPVSGLELLAADDASVYWVASAAAGPTTGSQAALFKAAPDGTNVVTLATLSSPTALAVDDAGLYLVDGSSLEEMNKDGTGVTTLVTLSSLQGMTRLTVDATSVYWSATVSNTIVAADKQGGGVRVVATGLPGSVGGLAVDAGTLYFSTLATKIDTSSDTEKMYGQIQALSAGGGAPRLLASYALPTAYSNGWVSDLAAGGSRVYATTVVAVASGDPQGVGDVLSIPE